jgi:hypothetical protein
VPDYSALREEITNDPLGRGYAQMTDLEIAADLNTPYRTRNINSITGSQIVNSIDPSEYAALTAEKQAEFWNVVHIGTINPWGVEATIMIGVFGAGSVSLQNLATLRVENITRMEELGYSRITEDTVRISGRN